MPAAAQENLEKKIKKHVYGKPQTVEAVFPSGFGEIALDEITCILETSWFPQKNTYELFLLKNTVRIHNIHLFSAVELLIRNQCLSDIRLVIFEGKASGISEFKKKCRTIPWNYYLNKSMSLKIKVDSIASRAFHETGLKEILGDIIKEEVSDIVGGDNSTETTCLYVNLYKDRLTISISLAGAPLYKRGYRGTLSASAPLREDIAACCLRKIFQFKKDVSPDTIIIPFSGTGTLAFEYLISRFQFLPALFQREYALQKMPLFRKENFDFFLKKLREHCLLSLSDISDGCLYNIDNSEQANVAFLENKKTFMDKINEYGFIFPQQLCVNEKNDFFNVILPNHRLGNIFIPLNPPYGIRLSKSMNTVTLYKKIAKKINEIAAMMQKKQSTILGFILCPSEETWSAFCKNIHTKNLDTYHFMQGGIDIRVCQFYI